MDVSRCAQSTWFIRVGIFFRSFRRETPNHWRGIAVLLTLLGGSRRVELPYAVVERWPWRLGGRVAVGRVVRNRRSRRDRGLVRKCPEES